MSEQELSKSVKFEWRGRKYRRNKDGLWEVYVRLSKTWVRLQDATGAKGDTYHDLYLDAQYELAALRERVRVLEETMDRVRGIASTSAARCPSESRAETWFREIYDLTLLGYLYTGEPEEEKE